MCQVAARVRVGVSARKLLCVRAGHPTYLLYFLLFGLIVGVIARLIVPGRESGGWPTSILIGILGSFVGGFLGRMLGTSGEGQSAVSPMSVFGAIVLLAAYHIIARRPVSM